MYNRAFDCDSCFRKYVSFSRRGHQGFGALELLHVQLVYVSAFVLCCVYLNVLRALVPTFVHNIWKPAIVHALLLNLQIGDRPGESSTYPPTILQPLHALIVQPRWFCYRDCHRINFLQVSMKCHYFHHIRYFHYIRSPLHHHLMLLLTSLFFF